MARAQTVRIKVLTSFNGMYVGDEADLLLTEKVQGWINAGLVVVAGGAGATGPGSVEPDDAERKQA